jgi:hypothetical protein
VNALRPRVRKLLLTAHITSSVGWLGAVAVFLALAVAGLTSEDAHVVDAAYLSMESVGRFVLVPLSVASLLTGLLQALTTKWGLFRHYWVLIKLVINVVATVVLLLYTQTLAHLAEVAAGTTSVSGDLSELQTPSPALHAGAALLLLLVATTLSVYKPAGVTRYGWRQQQAQLREP